MMRISKSVFAVGGVVLAGCLFTVMNPRSVHAVAAALVQVTNTASNPVVNADATRSAAQIVEIYCNPAFSCNSVAPGGAVDPTDYTVPAGQSLVITDIEILTQSGSYLSVFNIAYQPSPGFVGSYYGPYYHVASDGLTHHFALQRGIVWPSGGALRPFGTLGLQATLHGYLTAN